MASITQTLCTSFKVELLNAVHNFSTDTFKLALYSVANGATLNASTTAYTATGEIIGGGYTSSGIVLTVSPTPRSGGTPSTTAYLGFLDAIWAPATFSADGALIYNTSKSNKAVAVLNFGGTKSSYNNAFVLQFPVAGTGSSIIQIA